MILFRPICWLRGHVDRWVYGGPKKLARYECMVCGRPL